MKKCICLFTYALFVLADRIDEAQRKALEKKIIEAACRRDSHLPFCGVEGITADQGQISSKGLENGSMNKTERAPNGADPSLRENCLKAQRVASKYCDGVNRGTTDRAKCTAYFRDCMRFIPQTDSLYNIAKMYGSQVGINVWQFNVNGIPYYPINEEGGIGAQQMLNIPFGTWGGGYEGHVGVRDYWSQYQQAGANWYNGLYGYQSGWSVPLVQSLGVEGNGGTRVAVPLHNRDFGKIGVDNGYGSFMDLMVEGMREDTIPKGKPERQFKKLLSYSVSESYVGGYYSGNHHVGVDWKEGQVNNQLGIKIPFAGVGYNIGQAVAFPSLDHFRGKFIERRRQ